jgi:hypothetical protein
MRPGDIRSMRELEARLAQLTDLEYRYRQVVRNDLKQVSEVVRHPFRFLLDKLKSASADRGLRRSVLQFAVENGARLLLRQLAAKSGAGLLSRLLARLKKI